MIASAWLGPLTLAGGGEDVRGVQLYPHPEADASAGLVSRHAAHDSAETDRQGSAREGGRRGRSIGTAPARTQRFGIGEVVSVTRQRVPGFERIAGPGNRFGRGGVREKG